MPIQRQFPSRRLIRAASVAFVAGLALVSAGAAAQAHVLAIPDSTAGGAFTKITFRVPNESDRAATTKVVLNLPTDTPLAVVSAQQLDGWKITVTTSKLAKPVTVEGTTLTEAPTRITWTARAGGGIGPGEFQEFAIDGGPLPSAAGKQLTFPAEQTYSDGTVVKWNQPQPEGADEPEHPVPAFELTAALPPGADPDGAPAAPAPAAPAAAAPAAAAPAAPAAPAVAKSDSTARWLGGIGLVAGLTGLALGGLAWRRSGGPGPGGAGSDRRPPAAAGEPAGTGVGAGSGTSGSPS